MKNRYRKYVISLLKKEIKLQHKCISDNEKLVLKLKSELKEMERVLHEKCHQKAEYEKGAVRLLKGRKPKTSIRRWELFKEIVRRYTAHRNWKPRMYMDRLPDGRLSVKIGDGREFPKNVEAVLRSLADSFKVYYVTNSAYGDSHKGTRFYFANIPGTSKFAPNKVRMTRAMNAVMKLVNPSRQDKIRSLASKLGAEVEFVKRRR